MPRNSPTGFVTAFFAVVTGFALIWHIWWLVVLGLIGAYATFVVFAWRDHDEELIPARGGRPLRSRQPRRAQCGAAASAVAAGVRGMSAPSSALRAGRDPYHIGHVPSTGAPEYTGHGAGGPAPKRIVVGYGFWIFILSDVVLFSCFFATYTVLIHARNGGPGPARALRPAQHGGRDRVPAALELHLRDDEPRGRAAQPPLDRGHARDHRAPRRSPSSGSRPMSLPVWSRSGAGPTRSAFLTAFFALVGCHGAHVTAGLLWLGTMMAQFPAKGFKETIRHRYLCFSLFWHALDIIWVGIFTVVYLIGTITP